MRILQVVDDVLASAITARDRASVEAATIKEADEAPRTDLGKGLHAFARTVMAGDLSISYDDLAEVLK